MCEVSMFNKIKEFIKSPQFGEVFRFGVNGGICFVVDYAVMLLCLKVLYMPEWLAIGLGFTVSVILITGIGGMAISIGKVTITAIACALISGILINILLNKFKKPQDTKED